MANDMVYLSECLTCTSNDCYSAVVRWSVLSMLVDNVIQAICILSEFLTTCIIDKWEWRVENSIYDCGFDFFFLSY